MQETSGEDPEDYDSQNLEACSPITGTDLLLFFFVYLTTLFISKVYKILKESTE
jgi:hypothetical protein